ncbi:hypothetical protein BV22DRAFT_856679 [Leucogyrophana mollusca]|uniref:Uncharacterized protein n=1 Tax=Leucogyrophana mollusca TaxID=85980 RepID=A0ACB8B1F7_9AGAM|nr:hypothetical protein BV22DRAFT_856679 [Leucogyrophana mollusca]
MGNVGLPSTVHFAPKLVNFYMRSVASMRRSHLLGSKRYLRHLHVRVRASPRPPPPPPSSSEAGSPPARHPTSHMLSTTCAPKRSYSWLIFAYDLYPYTHTAPIIHHVTETHNNTDDSIGCNFIFQLGLRLEVIGVVNFRWLPTALYQCHRPAV